MERRAFEADGGVGVGQAGGGGLRRFSHEAMATVFEVYTVHPDATYAAQAAHAAFALVDRLEGELSRFIANSDISRINGLPAGAGTQVAPTTLECLLVARHLFDLTGGAFDIALGSGLPALELDPAGCRVRATAGGVRLDLGGVGKGYAVDLVAELLEDWGLEQTLVHGGFSSVLALEPPPGQDGWPLTLSDPAAPSRVLERLVRRQTALSASGLRKGDHIRDPRTGGVVHGRLAAWVAVPRPSREQRMGQEDAGRPRLAAAAVADGLTTALMLLDSGDIERLCAEAPGLEAWVLDAGPGAGSKDRPCRRFGGRAADGAR